MIYEVVVNEVLSDTFEIEAESGEEALEKAERLYDEGEIEVIPPGQSWSADFILL